MLFNIYAEGFVRREKKEFVDYFLTLVKIINKNLLFLYLHRYITIIFVLLKFVLKFANKLIDK